MYPIRLTRPIWCQTFYKDHICSDNCNIEYNINNSILRISYTSECIFPEKIEPTHIRISNFKECVFINDKINIPREVNVLVDYPMNNDYITLHNFNKDDIRVEDVLQLYQDLYKEIYKEEESKSTERLFRLKLECKECSDNSYKLDELSKFIEHDPNMFNEQCNICFENDEKKLFKIIKCKHIFHLECLSKWFNTMKIDNDTGMSVNSNSCPLCRQSLIYCNNCNGERIYDEEYRGVVIPFNEDINLRTIRIETDGPYQIHSLYFEELFFKGIMYDRITNTINLVPFDELDNDDDIEINDIEGIEINNIENIPFTLLNQ